MGRVTGTVLGLAVVGVAAIFIAKHMLAPAQEKAQRDAPVLTGNYQPRLVDCRILADSELPEGLPPPAVVEDLLYIEVAVLFPGVDTIDGADEMRLIEVNGSPDETLDAVSRAVEPDEDGTMLYLVFKTDSSFLNGRLSRGDTTIVERVELP